VLPAFDENGYLPPRIHRCDVGVIVERFGSGSPERAVQTQELLEFIEWARRAGIQRLLINGSYVTAKLVPNDVDIVVLPSSDYPRDEKSCTEEESRWPFLEIVIAADDDDFETWALADFGTDRTQLPKGVVEVIL
jgi:hypothetical protein